MNDAGTLLAHGLGGRSDLPLPPGYAVAGAALAVIASFVVLGLLWRRPKLSADAGRPLPSGVARILDSPVPRTLAQAVALLLVLAVLAVAFFGPEDTGQNLAPWVLYITFWCGLVPLSVLLGPVWRFANPLRLLHRGLAGLAGRTPRPMPAGLGYWPAALWLAGFVWLELVAPGRGDPRTVGALIVAYGLVNLAAATYYGSAWFARGDGFEVYSALFGRLSPLGRRAGDGAPVLRNPLSGLVGIRPEPGLVAVAVVLVGATAFDGLTRTEAWSGSVDPGSLPAGTLGLAGAIAFAAAVYVLALRATAELAGEDRTAMPGVFAPTLVPIALGYTVAHYFSFFLLEGQVTYILASDPFRTGADFFGTAGNRIDYTLVGPTLVAVVQVTAIVLGHVLGTVVAHDKAVARFAPAVERRAQLPVLAVMVVLTCTGVGLLFSG